MPAEPHRGEEDEDRSEDERDGVPGAEVPQADPEPAAAVFATVRREPGNINRVCSAAARCGRQRSCGREKHGHRVWQNPRRWKCSGPSGPAPGAAADQSGTADDVMWFRS